MNASGKKLALDAAIAQAINKLAMVDLKERCCQLRLNAPKDGSLEVQILGQQMSFELPSFQGHVIETSQPVHPVDRLLLLHYLQYKMPVQPTSEWITFRQFPGGDFYWQPFRIRTADPLLKAIGDDIQMLRERLGRFQWSPMEQGDLGARIQVLGPLEAGLVYNIGDEEFSAEVTILFDKLLTRIFCAEDAAAIASRICLGLTEQRCTPCSGCALCDK